MKLSERLDTIINEHHLLKHPFYQAWTEGRLNMDVLRRYAAQYHAQVATFPRFVSTVHAGCPEIDVRKALTENLADEEIHGVDHPELWLRFAEGLGASREGVRAEVPAPRTQALVDDFFAIARASWTDGLCALYAYEAQVPAVSESKVQGLRDWYDISDARTLEFFTAHQHYDVEHARKVADLIDRHADPATAEAATRKAVMALWGFLDGMAAEAGIDCTRAAA